MVERQGQEVIAGIAAVDDREQDIEVKILGIYYPSPLGKIRSGDVTLARCVFRSSSCK